MRSRVLCRGRIDADDNWAPELGWHGSRTSASKRRLESTTQRRGSDSPPAAGNPRSTTFRPPPQVRSLSARARLRRDFSESNSAASCRPIRTHISREEPHHRLSYAQCRPACSPCISRPAAERRVRCKDPWSGSPHLSAARRPATRAGNARGPTPTGAGRSLAATAVDESGGGPSERDDFGGKLENDRSPEIRNWCRAPALAHDERIGARTLSGGRG